MKEGPTMFMKTKERKTDSRDGPTMFMKTNSLRESATHYLYETKIG